MLCWTPIFNYSIYKKQERPVKAKIAKKGACLNKPKNVVNEKTMDKSKKQKNKFCY